MREALLAGRTHSRSRSGSERKVCNNLVFIENCCEAARESFFLLCVTSFNTLFLWALKVSCFRIYRCSSWFKTPDKRQTTSPPMIMECIAEEP